MRIAITSPDASGDLQIDGTPWEGFWNILQSLGHERVLLKESPDVIVFNNYSNSLWKKYGKTLESSSLILISWEPPENKSDNYKYSVLNKFGKKFYPSPIWAEEYLGEFFNWPQKLSNSFKYESDKDWEKRQDIFCFIQKNRWNLSNYSRYGLRRKVLSVENSMIHIFGEGWNQGLIWDSFQAMKAIPKLFSESDSTLGNLVGLGEKFSNVFGPIEDKMKVMRSYKYSLIIENSSDYISEKLFDALLSGTVPVYVGSDLSKFDIPSEIVLSAQPNTKSIHDSMRMMMQDKALVFKMRKDINQFICSQLFKQFENKEVFKKIAISISRYLNALAVAPEIRSS